MIKFISSPTVGINLANWGCFKMNEKSFGTAFLILLSLEPSISQEAITSQMAMLCLNKTLFSPRSFQAEYPQRLQQEPSRNGFAYDDKNCPSLDFTEGKEPRIRIFDRSSYTGRDFMNHMSHFKISFLIVFFYKFQLLFYQMMQTEESFRQKL